jgi:hypothetical protein
LANIANPYRAPVSVGNNDVIENFRVQYLVIGGNREAQLGRVEHALRGSRRGGDECGSDLFKGQPQRRKSARIDLNPDRRPTITANLSQGDTGHLPDLLGEKAVEQLVDPGEWQG